VRDQGPTTDRVHRRHLKERSQLHQLVEAEPWIFGEEYALATSDRGLTEVLKQNLHHLGRAELAEDITDEVLDTQGRRAIVDLLFAGEIAGTDDQLGTRSIRSEEAATSAVPG